MSVHTKRTLQLLALFTVVALGTFTTAPRTGVAAGCENRLGAGQAVPNGFGSPVNLFSGSNELLVQGSDCTPDTATLTFGSGWEQYVYRYGYSWSGTAWQRFSLDGDNQTGEYFRGPSIATVPFAVQGQPVYVVGYVCQQYASSWKCGCRDTACSTAYWQLQQVAYRAGSTGSTSSGGTSSGGQGAVKVYPAPTGAGSIPMHTNFVVQVNGQSSPVYTAKVASVFGYIAPPAPIPNRPVGFTNFDMSGSAQVVVTVSGRTVNSARVLPSAAGITPSVQGNRITVPITKPGKYELQINGSEENPLYLFANPMETNAPAPGAAGWTYYGPGVHNIGRRTLGANSKVYLAGGAVVNGSFVLNGANITVRGRGILNGSSIGLHDGNMLLVYNGGHLIEGITITDSPGWTVSLWGVNDTTVDNVKIFGYRQNTDGIDITSGQRVVVRNSFLRNWDDGVVVKAVDRDVYDVLVENNVISNDMGWGAMEIGAETRAAKMSNIRFINNDILHTHAHNVFGIENSDQALITDVTVRDIRVEDHHGDSSGGKWFYFYVGKTPWGGDQRGSIRNITIENVHFLSGDHKVSTMQGSPAPHDISGVRFIGLKYKGTPLLSAAQAKVQIGPNVSNVTFAP